MCGICGIFYFDRRSIDGDRLQAMNQKMLHRGPDDNGLYQAAGIALGMRRLSIIDTAGGHQPIHNEDQTVWVVMNGEIYNYIELRQQLESQGHQFYTNSDTEVLVHLYEQYGLKAIEHLNGMFAFALYDLKKNQLWVARDRLGIKPLYYYQTSEYLCFSSDLSSLMTYLGKKPLNLDGFYHYFAFNFFPKNQAPYQGVAKLLPGEWVLIKKSGVERQQYWRLKRTENFTGSREEAKVQVDNLLKDSVKIQLRSDVPLAISLSGGLDSSAIVAYAAKTGLKLNAYGVNFVGKESQDTVFARQVAERYGVNYQQIDLTADDLFSNQDTLMRYVDEPIADSAIYASYKLAEAVYRDGVKVLLSGAGGDEIFGGYHRHFLPSFKNLKLQYQRLPKSLRYIMGALVSHRNLQDRLRIQDDRIDYGISISGAQLALYKYLCKTPAEFKQIISSYQRSLDHLGKDTYSRMLSDLDLYLPENILALFDKSSMAVSVEGRVPLLDHRLVEFMFTLPQAMTIGGGMKGLFKEVLSGLLPTDLLTRKKEGFNAPMSQWLAKDKMKMIKEVVLSQYSSLFHHFFDQQCLEKLFDETQRYRYGEQSLFHLYFLALWFDQVGSCYTQ